MHEQWETKLPFPKDELSQLFYWQIAPGHFFPGVSHSKGEEPINAHIVNPITLSINGLRVSLRGHELHLFNTLAFLRNGWAAYSNVAQLGFAAGLSNRWSAYQEARDSLERRLPYDLFEERGRTSDKACRLSPRLRLIDVRKEALVNQERVERLHNALMYSLIVGPSASEKLRYKSALSIDITGASRIRVGQKVMRLPSNELYLLNMLRLAGPVLTFDQMYTLGFDMFAPSFLTWRDNLERAVSNIDQKLAGAGKTRLFRMDERYEAVYADGLYFEEKRQNNPADYSFFKQCQDALKRVQTETWTPVHRNADRRFVAATRQLTVPEIAEAVGVHSDDVHAILGRLGIEGQNKYEGADLIAIQEELVGVPVEYLIKSYDLNQVGIDELELRLYQNGYRIFDGYISPRAAIFARRLLDPTLRQRVN
ncbi:MAG TPA: hypothetical protein VFB59_04505 [Candidatus Saccharimonadales bacterium]|nr:hypothetical protein [Candidatus Saccharimonadales bacterium]